MFMAPGARAPIPKPLRAPANLLSSFKAAPARAPPILAPIGPPTIPPIIAPIPEPSRSLKTPMTNHPSFFSCSLTVFL